MTDQTNEQFEKGAVDIDQVKSQMLMQEIRDNQNLLFGTIGGIVAAAIGAATWAVITALTNFQIGWMAVGVGFLVGYAVRICGKGIDKSFGSIAAILSLVGCLAGNLLTVCIVVSRHQQIPFLDLLSRLNPEIIVGLIRATFNPMDILFYGIAVYEGYKFSFARISKEEGLADSTK
jgi:hypothetical protein